LLIDKELDVVCRHARTSRENHSGSHVGHCDMWRHSHVCTRVEVTHLCIRCWVVLRMVTQVEMWVRTNMTGGHAPQSAKDTVSSMIDVIDKAIRKRENGKIFSYPF
jgi:hypothetical protein